MQRFHQILFAFALVALCWLLMMVVHELGHVIGAILTGGRVEKVILHPLAISRTDVSPNPQPGIVVWFGPLLGCLLPLAISLALPSRIVIAKSIAKFFAGFCLIANGAYISLGFFGSVGDCAEMLRTGTPAWVMFAFGGAAVLLGLTLWHQLGSIQGFFARPHRIPSWGTYITLCTLLLITLILAFSPT